MMSPSQSPPKQGEEKLPLVAVEELSESAKKQAIQLLIGAGGIYSAFLYYGSLQEDVFAYTDPQNGKKFTQAWFLQVIEAAANVIVGYIGLRLTGGGTPGLPLKPFAITGAAQVSAKACTSLSLAKGLSFPVATLAKSGKMAPVMMGSICLGGASYGLREYLQVAALVLGTALVSMGKKKKSSDDSSSFWGVFYILLSLTFDGITAGYQKRLQKDMLEQMGSQPKPYDFMFWTNLCMGGTALVIGATELASGWSFCSDNPEILSKIIKFAICSAIGQSFIFFTLATFDPLVLTTVTTSRKIFSVLLSIFLKGHALSLTGWSGLTLAVSGILAELQAKLKKKKRHG